MPRGDPAGYLPSVKRARMKGKHKMSGGAAPGSGAERQMMGQHDTPQGKAPAKKMNPLKRARRRAFLGF